MERRKTTRGYGNLTIMEIRKKADKNYLELIKTLVDSDNDTIAELIISELEDKGLNVDIYAPSAKFPSMSMALDNYISKANKKK